MELQMSEMIYSSSNSRQHYVNSKCKKSQTDRHDLIDGHDTVTEVAKLNIISFTVGRTGEHYLVRIDNTNVPNKDNDTDVPPN